MWSFARLCLLLPLLSIALSAETVILSVGSTYVALTPEGAWTTTTDSAAAQPFQRLYAGNGYFFLRTPAASYVDPNLGATPSSALAEQFRATAAAGSTFALYARSSAAYLRLSEGAFSANANVSSASLFTITPAADPAAGVEFDFSNPRQRIAGFGAASAFYTNWLSAHPNKEQIYSLLFSPDQLGASLLRLQNIYGQSTSSNFDPDSKEIAARAAAYRGSAIPILLTSWSPPAALKASGKVACDGNQSEPGCTLAKVNGAFNYDGFATYWYDSLNAYSAIGVSPTYISLQNEPDWTPSGYAGCRFDATERTGGTYAGYRQALDTVYPRLQSLPSPPTIVGPEVIGLGYNVIENYLAALPSSSLDQLGAVAHHLYHGGTSGAPGSFSSSMFQLAAAAQSKPLFQTEFDHSKDQNSPFQTAALLHDSMAVEEASVYLYWSFAWPDENQLVYIDFPWDRSRWKDTQTGFHLTGYYHAFRHFSRFVQPGFQRVAAPVSLPGLQATAYYTPKPSRLVVVLLNSSTTDTLTPTLALPSPWRGATAVYRSTFLDSDERFAELGPLPDSNQITLPPQSVATVVLDQLEGQAWDGFASRPDIPIAPLALSVPNLSLSLNQGASLDLPVTLIRNGASADVTLSLAGLPAGATASIQDPANTSSGVISITSTPETLSGSYPLTLQATDGTNSAELPLTLTIQLVPRIPSSYAWTISAPVLSPVPDSAHPIVSIKDPTFVFHNDAWNLYATTADTSGNWNMVHLNFKDWSEAAAAKPYYMDATPGFRGYRAAPQIFYFRPHQKWYMVYQAGPPHFSTTDDPSKPETWSAPQPFFASMPASVSNWIDFWVICDTANCYLFFSGDNGNFYRSQTPIDQFPQGFSEPVIVLHSDNAGDLFEASCTYSLAGTNQYLTLIEAMGGPEGRRYFRAFVSDRLDGAWTALPDASTWDKPFLGINNVTFADGITPWTRDFSHGELLRSANDETLPIDPTRLQFLFQGYDPTVKSADYSQIPWQLGWGQPDAVRLSPPVPLTRRQGYTRR